MYSQQREWTRFHSFQRPEITFTTPGIQKQLEAVIPDKACGPDLVPARILKEAAAELAPVLTSLFQQSYDSGSIPSAWKAANISAIFKKGIRSDPTNYRPVSLTSIVCKVVEHVVCSHMSHHKTINSIIISHQHAFLRRLSCETQLVTVIHDWVNSLNSLRRPKATGCCERDILRLWSPVVSGVPQGTVLGPALFLLLINDLPDNISSNIKLFADDLLCLARWAATWQMSFAPKKCMKMTLTPKKSRSKTITGISLISFLKSYISRFPYV